MKSSALLLIGVFCLTWLSAHRSNAAEAEASPSWRTNLTESFAFAAAAQRPILLYFTADWCGPCRQMAKTTFQDATVITMLTEFVAVAADLDREADEASRRNVPAIPTFLVLTPDGQEVKRTTGLLGPEPFQGFLTTALVATDLAQSRQEDFLRKQAEVARALDSGQRTRAIALLIELCADPEPARARYAGAEFRKLAKESPRDLVTGLENERLAVRLAVANALRDELGDRWEFDPWAPAQERAELIAQLRSTLPAKD